MIVCHCERVSSAVIDATIAGGASSTTEVTERCRAGGRCGSCLDAIQELLDVMSVDATAAAQSAA